MNRPLIATVLLTLLLAVFVVLRFEVTTDISHFMPTAEDKELGTISRELAQSELSRTLILMLESSEPSDLVAASKAFEEALRNDVRIASTLAFLEGGPSPNADKELWELYAPRRLSFAASSVEQARARFSDTGMTDAAKHLRQQLSGPMSALIARAAPSDPFLALPTLFQRLGSSRSNDLKLRDQRFFTSDGEAAVLFLGTKASAFDADVQGPLLAATQEAFEQVNKEFEGRLSLSQSGVSRFATRAAQAIKEDIRRVSVVSLVLLASLMVLLFRSLRLMGLTFVPILVGVVFGSAVVLALFGRLHGITLAFGASLIGVSVDYVFHFYAHHAVARPGTAAMSIREVRVPVVTGAVTTVVGFSALGASSLAGLREVACFSVAGILGALLSTLFVLPALVPKTMKEVGLRRSLTLRISGWMNGLRRLRKTAWALPIGALLISGFAIPQMQYNDDFASMSRLDPDLVQEDERVRQRIAMFEQMRFVVALGTDNEAALVRNDAVARQLELAVQAGELSGFRSVAGFLPSAAKQTQIAALARSDSDFWTRFEATFAEAGFAVGGFDEFRSQLDGPEPEPLRYNDLASSSLASWVVPFHVTLGERVGFVTLLEGVQDEVALSKRFESEAGVAMVKQAELFGEAHQSYQRDTFRLIVLGLFAVFAVLWLRYRNTRQTLSAFIPSLVAAGVTVSVLTLTGFGLDLISLTALLFVVSMGVDYGVFLVDGAKNGDGPGFRAALLSITLACVSTVMGFGLLAFSDHPVLATLGLTAAVGIVTSLIMAPLTLVMLQPTAPRSAN